MVYRDRVHFDDVDFARTPFYGRYFSWVDRAWELALNEHGIWFGEMVGRRGLGLPIVEVSCRYLRPLALDDDFTVQIRISELTRREVTTEFRVHKLPQETLMTEGYVRRRFVDMEAFRATDVPDDIFRLFERMAESMAEWTAGENRTRS